MDSETVNYFRLNLLLTESTKILQGCFREYWQKEFGSPWPDDQAGGSQIEAIYNHQGKKKAKGKKKVTGMKEALYPSQVTLVRNGDCAEWDISLLNAVFDVLTNYKNAGFPLKKELEAIRNARNEQQHNPSSKVSAADFASTWKDLVTAISAFTHFDQVEVDRLRVLDITVAIAEANGPSNYKVEVAEAVELKNLANEAHKSQDFLKAVELYTKALMVPAQTQGAKAILYSNRSASYLQLGQFENAKEDANTATQIATLWWRPHFRLGRCYDKLEKLENAIQSYNVALALNPGNKEVETERSDCRRRLGVAERSEHMNPYYQPKTLQEQFADASAGWGEEMKLGNSSPSDISPKAAKFINSLVPGQFDCSIAFWRQQAQHRRR